jgi:4-amino-4-deoxy-L-arabinose transferase-like glycosyltransferase
MRAPWLHLCLLSALGALLFLPSFAAEGLDDEEGRRAVPAREMVESGDWILPRVFGEPYLNKPPLYFWSVAAASSVTGGVNEAATRLPSVLATIATALASYLYGRRAWGARAGLAAGASLRRGSRSWSPWAARSTMPRRSRRTSSSTSTGASSPRAIRSS